MDNFISWMESNLNENQEFIDFVNSKSGEFDPKTILNQWEKIQKQKKLKPSVLKKNIPNPVASKPAIMKRTGSPAPINNIPVADPVKKSRKKTSQVISEPQALAPEPIQPVLNTDEDPWIKKQDEFRKKFNFNYDAKPNVLDQSKAKSVVPYNPSYDDIPTDDEEAENMDIYKNFLQNHSGFGYGTGGGERVMRSSRNV